jgi:hypothetical protein
MKQLNVALGHSGHKRFQKEREYTNVTAMMNLFKSVCKLDKTKKVTMNDSWFLNPFCIPCSAVTAKKIIKIQTHCDGINSWFTKATSLHSY